VTQRKSYPLFVRRR